AVLGLVSDVNFIRTTDPHHKKAAQEFWKRCEESGDIYKKEYKIKYCVGCELEKTDSELVEGKCPIHPNLEIEIINEENYFFRFSKYQKPLLELYEKNPDFVLPDFRFNEIKSFVKSGLEDFSISRLKNKMPWGVHVPGDDEHVMYVWFDALVNYISAIGWPVDMDKFNQYWPVIQLAGKDNLRQQSAMWQAMLMSAGVPASRQILIHGFIQSEGQKMSKSLGNVVNPISLVNEYGTDALRYYLLREIPTFDDGDFSMNRFKEVYNADLANGLGNLIARVAKLCETTDFTEMGSKNKSAEHVLSDDDYTKSLTEYKFNDALSFIWQKITKVDQFINEEKPWELLKTDPQRCKSVLAHCVDQIQEIAILLSPFLPETTEKITEQFKGPKILSQKSLFPRI
ncbi:MAG TPA: methionine--tRNA ligase, partial [Candidatus Saccharimonadales bacterium]|nr:methionine--tRNA ligase [Candidatus Saccharimonadales bacterium]